MKARTLQNLTFAQQNRLDEAQEAIQDEDMILDINGLHPLLDELVGTVECPYEGWRTRDLSLVTAFVFPSSKVKFTADQIAAEYALRRDRRYGL